MGWMGLTSLSNSKIIIMGWFNKDKEKGGLGRFIKKVAGVFPEAINIGTQLATGNVVGAIGGITDLLKNKAEHDESAANLLAEFELNKMEWQLEVYKIEVEDRQGARSLYSSDSMMQKVFAILFLIGYVALSWYLLQVLIGTSEMPKLAETMITMIWTGTSTKLNTIVDFFFGGSATI